MEKKYTLKEFDEMFRKAQSEVLKELEKIGNDDDQIVKLLYSFTCMMAMDELHTKLFRKE